MEGLSQAELWSINDLKWAHKGRCLDTMDFYSAKQKCHDVFEDIKKQAKERYEEAIKQTSTV